MSRLGKSPLALPKGVEIKVDNENVHVKGPKGNLSLQLRKGISLKIEENFVYILMDEKVISEKAVHGLYWALVRNMLTGVDKGYEKRLTLVGVGFRAAIKGNDVELQVGYSFPLTLPIPAGLAVTVEKGTEIIVSGINKQLIGEFAATLRSKRPPEPYKGKGIRYKEEYVRKKAGKAAKSK
jgi:large subunit ribosomal protein L6